MRGAATQEMTVGGFSAAHPSLPLNSKVKVMNPETGVVIEVTIVSRINPSLNRIVDLSPAAMRALGIRAGGTVVLSVDAPSRPELQPAGQDNSQIVELPEFLTAPKGEVSQPKNSLEEDIQFAISRLENNAVENWQIPAVQTGNEFAEDSGSEITKILNEYLQNEQAIAGRQNTRVQNLENDYLQDERDIELESVETRQRITPVQNVRRRNNEAEENNAGQFPPMPSSASRMSGMENEFLAWMMMMTQDARDAREAREAREVREIREAREAREARELREAREVREARELREAKEGREALGARSVRQPREVPETGSLPYVSPSPVQEGGIQIMGLPDRNSDKLFRLQVGAFSRQDTAETVSARIKDAGFDVTQDYSDSIYRVFVVDVAAADVYPSAVKLGALGFNHIWVRE